MTADTKITKIMLLKDMIFPYSGKAYVVFPRGSQGFIVHDWSDVSWIPEDEKNDVQAMCRDGELLPAYIENKLICVRKSDFKEVKEHAST